jgi:hypothetical protein
VLDERVEFFARDASEIWDDAKLLPAAIRANSPELEGHRKELMNQDGPAACLFRDRLHPLLAGKLDKRHSLKNCATVIAEERGVRVSPGATTCSPHSLKERGDGAGGVLLEDEVQVTHVYPQLEGGRANDACVLSVVKALLGSLALLERHGASTPTTRSSRTLFGVMTSRMMRSHPSKTMSHSIQTKSTLLHEIPGKQELVT